MSDQTPQGWEAPHQPGQPPGWGPPPAGWSPASNPPGKKPWWRRTWVLVLAAFIVGGMVGTLGNDNTQTTAAAPPQTVPVTSIVTVTSIVKVPVAPTETAPPKTTAPKQQGPPSSFDDGIWRVGKDIRPGTYRTQGGDNCYWARLKNLSGGFDAIIANGNPSGPVVVAIRSSDVGFESQGCGEWKRV